MVTTAGYIGIIVGVIAASIPAGMGAEIGKRMITPILDRWDERRKIIVNDVRKSIQDLNPNKNKHS
jgi:hypothetical protein